MPLTASLYVPGTLDDASKVLVDVGTGYFVEVCCFVFPIPIFMLQHGFVIGACLVKNLGSN